MTKNIYAGSNLFCNRLKLVLLKDRWLKCKTRQEYIANLKFTTNIIFVYKFILFNFKSLGLRNERNSPENNDRERKVSIITIFTIKHPRLVLDNFIWWEEFDDDVFLPSSPKKYIRLEREFFLVWFYIFWTNLGVFWVERLVYWGY